MGDRRINRGIAQGPDLPSTAQPPIAEPERRETVYLLRRDHPQVELTWASRFPRQLDKIKIRKHFTIFPVKFTLKADYDTATNSFYYGASAKDVFLNGRLSYNVPERQIEYRKAVRLPSQNGTLVFSGTASLRDLRQVQPNFGVQLHFGGDTHHPGLPHGHADAVWVGNSWDVRQRFSLGKGFGVEVCGGVALPTPTARYSHSTGVLALGEGAFNLHVAEVNAVLTIQ